MPPDHRFLLYTCIPDVGPSKKKVRRRSSVQQSDSEEDEEDDTWHYEGDKCDAYDCKRPKSKKVSWVSSSVYLYPAWSFTGKGGGGGGAGSQLATHQPVI